MRKSDKQNVLAAATVVLCIMFTLGLCYFLNGEGFLLALNYGEEGEKYYCVCAGAYEDLTLARSSAELVKSRGGAGYVIAGEELNDVVLAVYANKEEAENVLGNAASGGSYIKEISISEIKTDWADKALREDISEALGYFDIVFDKFKNLAEGLSGETLTLVDVRTSLAVLKSQIDEMRISFNNASSGKDDGKYTEIKLALVTAIALIENTEADAKSSSAVVAVSSLRYQSVQLVLCRQALANVLSK